MRCADALVERTSRPRPGPALLDPEPRNAACRGRRPAARGAGPGERDGRSGRHHCGARRKDLARPPAPRLARPGGELCRRLVGHRRPHRRRAHRLPPHHRPSAPPRRVGAPFGWPGGGGAAPPAAEQASTTGENIAAHYDLSNDFFALMLDPTMAYSCGFFADDGTSLEAAQTAKFEMIAAKLQLGPEDHVIEIGTGWGGFAIHAAARHGCRVTTTTISEAQRALAEKRVAEHGLSDRVTVLGEDYRDLRGRYDALVSIEMIEAVDWRRHDQFFATCARLLTDQGRMALQAITIEDASYERAKLHDDFIRAMVFPGGCLPSVSSIASVGGAHIEPADRRPGGHRPPLRRDAPALAAPTWKASARRSRPSASTSASGASGRCTSATAKRRSWSATCPTSNWSWPDPGPAPADSAGSPASSRSRARRFSARRDPVPRPPGPGCAHHGRSTAHRAGRRAPRRRFRRRRRGPAGPAWPPGRRARSPGPSGRGSPR